MTYSHSAQPATVRTIICLLFVAVLLAGCSHAANPQTPTVERLILTPPERITATDTPTLEPSQPAPPTTPAPTETRKKPKRTRPAPTLTLTPSPAAPKATQTSALPPEDILIYRPFDLATSVPSGVSPEGALVVRGEQMHLLYFDPQVRLENFADLDEDCLSTSPDGKWIASCPLSDASPTGRWLMVESANRQQHYQVSMDMFLISFGDYEWLDNQRLKFPLVRVSDPYKPMVVINPFTGVQNELPSDYPGIVGSNAGSAGTMSFQYSDVVYDASLNLVVFPEQRNSLKYIALWNRQSNSILAEVEDKGKFLHYPLWSPDGKQFAVAARQKATSGRNVEEWFSVSREGQVEQLTHFGDYFNTVTMGAKANWSPDGQKLAFWFNTKPSSCPGVHLAVLEIATRQVTDTCIPGTFGFSKPPAWSLDSRYIALRNAGASSDIMILVDFEQGRAFDITKYGVPFGWLAAP